MRLRESTQLAGEWRALDRDERTAIEWTRRVFYEAVFRTAFLNEAEALKIELQL
jgi:hypothetical protein